MIREKTKPLLSYQVSIIEADNATSVAECLLKFSFFFNPVSKLMIFKMSEMSELCHPFYCVSFCSVRGKCFSVGLI